MPSLVMARRSAGHPGDADMLLKKYLSLFFAEERKLHLGGPH